MRIYLVTLNVCAGLLFSAACALPDVTVREDANRHRPSNDGGALKATGGAGSAAEAGMSGAAVGGEGGRTSEAAGSGAPTPPEPNAAGAPSAGSAGSSPEQPREEPVTDAGAAGSSSKRTWTETQTVELPGSLTKPNLAIQPESAATLLWQQPNASPKFPTVSSKRYSSASGWSATTKVFDAVHSNSSPFALTADAKGNLIALIWSGEVMFSGSDPTGWTKSSMGSVLETRSLDGGGTWTAPKELAVTALLAQSSFSLSAIDSGEAVAVTTRVLEEGAAVGWVVEGSHLTANGAWSAPAPVAKATATASDSDPIKAAAQQMPTNPGTSLSSAGEAAFIWRYLSGGVSVVVESASLLTTAIAPSQPPKQLSAAPPTAAKMNLFEPRVAWDGAGHAHAAWLDYNGTYWTVRASRYAASSGWGPSMSLDTNVNGDAWQPELAIDASGDAIVAWTQTESASITVWYARYDANGSSWSKPERITPLSGNAASLSLGVDRAGDGIAVWEDLGVIRASRYSAGQGWDSSTQLSPGNQVAQLPTLKLTGQGNGLVMWSEKISGKLALHLRRYE